MSEKTIVSRSPKKCKTCANALFNETWGDYKCRVDGYYVYTDPGDCKDYKEGTPGVSKQEPESI